MTLSLGSASRSKPPLIPKLCLMQPAIPRHEEALQHFRFTEALNAALATQRHEVGSRAKSLHVGACELRKLAVQFMMRTLARGVRDIKRCHGQK